MMSEDAVTLKPCVAALNLFEICHTGITVGLGWLRIHFRPGLFKRLKGAIALLEDISAAAPVRQVKMRLVSRLFQFPPQASPKPFASLLPF